MVPLTMDSRRKQFFGGLAFISAFALLLLLIRAGGYLPGGAGKFFGMLLRLGTTPFFMEAGFFLVGLALLFILNHLRSRWDGDEFVEIEDFTLTPGSTPRRAKRPRDAELLEPPADVLLATAEGAFALGDHASALEILSTMEPAQRDAPDGLALRLRLARATGCAEVAAKLRALLAATAPGHPALDVPDE
jgi:hypothetical protein